MRVTKRSRSIILAMVAAIVAPLILMNYPSITVHSSSIVATVRRPAARIERPAGASSALSVTPVLDTARAATATITTAGGTLTATAANGAVFTLTIPAGAIDDEETITMTPITSISDLPLSGGLAAAVELAPDGLILWATSTLVIKPPATIPVDQQSPFAWYDTGDDFHLYPLTIDVNTLTMTITHLCGYGIGVGTSADRSAVQGHLPSRNQAQVDQVIQGYADTARQKLAQFVTAQRSGESPQGGQAKTIKKYNKAVDNELISLMNSLLGVLDDALAKGDDISLSCALLAVLDDLNFIKQYGFDMGTLLGSVPQYEGKIAEALNKITDNAIKRCNGDSENPPNPGEIGTVLSWAAFANKLAARDPELAGLGPVATLMVRRALACANLTLVMNTGVNFMPPGTSFTIFIELDAENDTAVKLTPQFALNGDFNGVFTGTGILKHQKVGVSGIPDCGITDTSTDGLLTVESLKFNVTPREVACGSQNAPPLVIESALINVSRPIETFTLSCPEHAPYTANADLWRANFYCGHQGDSISGNEFNFTKWDPSADPTILGTKEYSNYPDPAPCFGFTENTTIKVVAGK